MELKSISETLAIKKGKNNQNLLQSRVFINFFIFRKRNT